jgi:iron complex outermembrane receptor protein
MKFAFGGASRAALLIALGTMGWAGSAAAQQAPADTSTTSGDKSAVSEVVVTGSLIRGTPADTALPVEVITQFDLEKRGEPSALEFAKDLTISGPTTGEAYYFGGAPPGSVSYNLRGIGSDKTLTLLNGLRVSQNASNIPFAALSRTEVLKDGAAVTYGADAVGGVVNFITRDHFVGLEAGATYKAITGSAGGDYTGSLLAGIGEGDVNFLVSAEYQHRSRLNTLDRNFSKASLDPTVPGYNPAPWSTLTNLAGWVPRGALPATPSVANEFGTPTGGIISDFTPSSCAAVGGRYDNTYTCAYNYVSYYNLVETNDIYRGYAQLNAKVTDKINAHVEASYAQVSSPQIFGSPAQPVITGPALATGLLYQFYVPTTNPYAAAFAAANGAPAGTAGFTPLTYRSFAHGGNPFLGDGNGFGVPSKYDSQVFRVSGSLKGDLGGLGPLENIGYNTAVTFNQSDSYADSPDVIGYRLQQALDGFGGPNCNAPDLDPNRFGTQNPALAGVGNCSYWNPFASNFKGQPNLGKANPSYVAGAQNSEALTRWLFDPRATKTTANDLTFDASLNGQLNVSLPGGKIGWAGGFQARALQNRTFVGDPLYNGNTPCPWPTNFTSTNGAGTTPLSNFPVATTDPSFRGCTPDSPGPFTFFSTNVPVDQHQNQESFFGELQIPVLDNLNFQLAARHEQFTGDLKSTVYKIASKWHVWGPISLRGSYGTNFLAPALGLVPGQVNNGVASYTIDGGNWLGAQYITDSHLKPATAAAANLGAIWESRGFSADHKLQVTVDYFDIRTKDEIGQIADVNQIANLVFSGANSTVLTCDPTVQPLINRVTFNAGCVAGVTSAVGGFSSISTVVGNGPGQSTNGIDVQVTYRMPLGKGDLTLDLTGTDVLKLVTGPTTLDGVVVAPSQNRLGNLNFATVATAAPRLRTNFALNYALDRNNIRLGVNYVSAVKDQRAGTQYGENGANYVTVDLTDRYEITPKVAVTFTIANMFDRSPPPAQEELGYDPRLGDPLGRTFELGLKKTF